MTVRANDLDYGENGRVMYSIKSGDRQNQFKIDHHHGVVSVARGDLDREMISSYVLEIEAADHGMFYFRFTSGSIPDYFLSI